MSFDGSEHVRDRPNFTSKVLTAIESLARMEFCGLYQRWIPPPQTIKPMQKPSSLRASSIMRCKAEDFDFQGENESRSNITAQD